MKTAVYLLLVAISMTGCALDSASPTVTPTVPVIKTLDPTQAPSPLPIAAKQPHQLPTVINQVIYLYGSPPEKKITDFKQTQAANDYFGLLLQKLKQRHGILDAKLAQDAGVFYVISDYPSNHYPPHTMTIIYSGGNPSEYEGHSKFDAYLNCYINKLQGSEAYYGNTAKSWPRGSGDLKNYRQYVESARQYAVDWNYIMLPACAKRTGDFKKPPDQSPPF